MIPLWKYPSVKDRYCVCYFGHCDECLLLLQAIRPAVESAFPGLRMAIGCRDDRAHLIGSDLLFSELKTRRGEFGHIREIRGNGRSHPVEDFLAEADLNDLRLTIPPTKDLTARCLIVASSNPPTRPLTQPETAQLAAKMVKDGYEIVYGCDDGGAGLVAGVESVQLVRAALRGVPVRLWPSGAGTRLYKQLLPNLELIG